MITLNLKKRRWILKYENKCRVTYLRKQTDTVFRRVKETWE